MDYRQIKHQLEQMAEDCSNLAKKLSSDGDALNSNEQQLITFSQMPYIRETYEVAIGCLVAGNVKTAYEMFIKLAEMADQRGA